MAYVYVLDSSMIGTVTWLESNINFTGHSFPPFNLFSEVLGAPGIASMLREEFVSDYSKNVRNKIENSLRGRLQNFKVVMNLDVVDNLCFQCAKNTHIKYVI